MISPALSARETALFCHKLGALYIAGVPIHRALQALAAEAGGAAVRRRAANLLECLRRGATLGQAVHWERRGFPHFFVTLVIAAETCGRLDEALGALELYYEDRAGLIRLLVRQVTYPLSVVLAAIVAIPLMRLFWTDTLTLGNSLRALTPFLSLSGALVVCMALTAIGLRVPMSAAGFRQAGMALGPMRQLARARFGRAMQFFTESGLPLRQALPAAGESAGIPTMQHDLRDAAHRVQNGEPVAEALRVVRMLPRAFIASLAVAEDAGKIDEAFRRFAEAEYDKAVFSLRVGLGALEGLLILLLGGWIILRVG